MKKEVVHDTKIGHSTAEVCAIVMEDRRNSGSTICHFFVMGEIMRK